MGVAIVQVLIDDSSDKTITGTWAWDRDNGGSLIVPAGPSFPSSPNAGELFWYTVDNLLYRRDDSNSTWVSILSAGYVVTSRTITAGTGLTGGGDLSVDRTLNVGANADGSIVVNADDIQVGVLATDAQHGVRGGGTQHATATTGVAGFMSATDKTKLDGVEAGATNTPLTSSSPVNVDPTAAVVGVDTTVARADHKHSVGIGAPVNIGTVNATGSSNNFVRSDHVHALPESVLRTILATVTAALDVNAQRIGNAGDPVNPQDLATKAYVDALSMGLSVKASVRVVTTSNITLSGTQTVDGVLLVIGDRVLVAGQTTASQNGIYVVASGVWTRATDADTSAEVTAGMFTFVTEGAAFADSGWVLTTNNPITLGTTSLAFTQFSGAGQISAGTGLTKSGNTLNVGANADGSIVVNADDIQVGVLATDAQHGVRGGGTQHATATTGVAGFMSATDKTKLDGIAAGAAPTVLTWGNNGVTATTTTRFLSPGWEDGGAPTTAIQYRAPRAGTFRNLRIRHNTTAGNGNAIVYTLRVNGSASALSVSMASTASDGSDTVNTVLVAAGDLIDIQVTKAASIGSSPSNVMAVVELAS